MGAVSWLLWLLLSAAAVMLSVTHYRRRETPGRGRLLLALLRGGALALVLLLLFDPELPAAGAGAPRGTQVVLDGSLSMTLPGASDSTRWAEARGVARARAGDRPVLIFGDAARPVPVAALPDSAPGDVRSRLLPGLQAAAEAGVRRVVVVTDGAIEDADIVARWLPRLGLEVETVLVGGEAGGSNRSLVEVSAPSWVESGAPVPIRFATAGGSADSVRITVQRDGRVLGRVAVPPAATGRLAAGTLEVAVEPPEGGGWVRLEVALEGVDSIPADDVRSLYVQVGEEPAGIALVSLRPDWEPRFLAPVLTNALGLPLRAWLRSATGQYARLATGLEAGTTATEADVRRAVERSQLLVLHGLGVDAPEWALAAARQNRHVLIFPADESAQLPLDIGSEIPGDFFPSSDVPPSPLAPLLTGLETTGATPLTGVRQASPPEGAWVPLAATRGRQGAPVPLIVAGESGGRRWAISLGAGYWIWAFRGGSERQLYTRLWSALGGWLAQERSIAALSAVRPAAMSAPRGAPVSWIAPGIAADSIRLELRTEAGDVAVDTVLRRTGSDTMYASAPPPGHYRYRALAFTRDNVVNAEGPLTIERYSPELTRPAVDPAALRSEATMVRDDAGLRRGRPLHATAYPYLLLVMLLAAEWILRRRWGLR